jgi:hypothetical protein
VYLPTIAMINQMKLNSTKKTLNVSKLLMRLEILVIIAAF